MRVQPATDGLASTASTPVLTADLPQGSGSSSGTSTSLFLRLTVMMLLEFLVPGSWFATFGLVLATYKMATVIGTAYSLAAVAAIVSPMFLGALADRFVSSQKALATAHLIGGVLMLCLVPVVRSGDAALTLVILFAYNLFYQPTVGLATSISFRHLGENQRVFPYIRVFGTIGWVVAGFGVGLLGLSSSVGMFYVTAIASFVYGVYAFTLPKTPPPAKGVRFSLGDIVGSKAFVLFRNRNFAVLMVCALLTGISLGVYNSYASPFLGALGMHNVASLLAIGQASEVAFIVSIPFVLKRIGMKWGLLLGMITWAVRLSVFIAAIDGHNWLTIVGIALQGICNDFCLVLAALYIGRVAPAEISAQAQNMLILAISGLGALIGSYVTGQIYNSTVAVHAASDTSTWTVVWILPIAAALVAAVLWACVFRESREPEPTPAQ